MVLSGRVAHTGYTISVTPASLAVGQDEGAVWAWDRGGRLYAAVGGDATWRRALDGRVLETRREAGRRRRRVLPRAEADALLDASAARAEALAGAMAAGAVAWASPVDPGVVEEAGALLSRCAGFDAGTAGRDESRFASVYSPVGILPPDQYLALVLQATEGCSFNTCTFCDLYHTPYRVKSPDEFRAHVAGVFAFLGDSRLLRSRGIFLGAANALAVPQPRIEALFDVLAEEADGRRLGVSAFVDGFTGQMKTVADYAALRQRGLRRVYVGLESGHDPLLAFVRKPAEAGQAVATVRAAKAAGVQVGIMVMTGLGGEQFAAAHEADTVAALSAMNLGAGDVLYFSDLVAAGGAAYARLAAAAGITALDAAALDRQRERIRRAVRYSGAPPVVSSYDVGGFVW